MLAFRRLYIFFDYLILILILQECKAKNYCASNICNNTKQHTMCKFTSPDPARHCVEFEKTIRSAREKQAILDKLNSRRNKVAAGELRSLPSAANMMKLEWNEELEASAQRWANQCVKHHSPDIKDMCRDLDSMYVEQNIATIYGEASGLTPLALVDVWYMELLNVNASVIPRYRKSSDAGYNHYEYFTQLMWGNSRQVGCGGVKFKERLQDLGTEKKRAVYRLVCNFAPGGNIVNQSVYAAGPPCSQCPDQTCDAHHTALCSPISVNPKLTITDEVEEEPVTSLIKATIPKFTKLIYETRILTNLEAPQITTAYKNEDEELKPYDYTSHLQEFVRPSLVTSIKTTCRDRDILVVDEFLELLKKKLSTDPMFKDFLQTTALKAANADDNYTDAMALLSKIYSTKIISTTPSVAEKDYLNSTLLVDLVEAVIFRSGDKMKVTQEVEQGIPPELHVSPVKIQAELAEVRHNSDFTGHLFFPEDIDGDDTRTESTESYYDALNPQNPSIPDLELHAMKRIKATKDFLDEILDSETVSESTTKLTLLSPDYVNLYKSGHSSMKKFLEEIGEKIHEESNVIINKRDVTKELNLDNDQISFQTDYYDNVHEDFLSDDNRTPIKHLTKELGHDCKIYLVKYSELLKKLAADLRPLKLNEIFHCNRHQFDKRASPIIHIFILIVKYVFTLINET